MVAEKSSQRSKTSVRKRSMSFGDQDFRVEVDMFGRKCATYEKYFIVRARKGEEEEH